MVFQTQGLRFFYGAAERGHQQLIVAHCFHVVVIQPDHIAVYEHFPCINGKTASSHLLHFTIDHCPFLGSHRNALRSAVPFCRKHQRSAGYVLRANEASCIHLPSRPQRRVIRFSSPFATTTVCTMRFGKHAEKFLKNTLGRIHALHLLFHRCSARDRNRGESTADREPKKTTKSACLHFADRRRRSIKSIYIIPEFIPMPGILR